MCLVETYDNWLEPDVEEISNLSFCFFYYTVLLQVCTLHHVDVFVHLNAIGCSGPLI